MELTYVSFGILLGVGAIIAMVSRRLGLPYTFALVVAGIGLSLIPGHLEPQLSDRIIYGFLPALIFETAYDMPWKDFRHVLWPAVWLAVPGVLFVAGAVAAGLVAFAGWNWRYAALLGVVIAPTDPVAVIPLLRSLRGLEDARAVLKSESMLNDGTSAVGFGIASAIALGGSVSFVQGAGEFLWSVMASAAIGAAIAYGLVMIAGRTDDHLVELTFSTIAAYGSFLIAQNLGFSGVLATLASGMVLGSSTSISERGRFAVKHLWDYLAFVANSCIFLLIGYRIFDRNFGGFLVPIAVAIGVSIAGRAAFIYGSDWLPFMRKIIDLRETHLVAAAGLRGALSVALCLSLPAGSDARNPVLTVTLAVVAFSIIVQSLALKPIGRWTLGREMKTEPGP